MPAESTDAGGDAFMPHRRVSPHYHPSGQHALATHAGVHAVAAAQRPADYTLAHGGRHIRLGPIAFWVTVGTLVIMAVWTITTGTYFAFRDEVLTRLIARQADMQFGYEDRIADLRAQIDRISSRQLIDQEQYEQRLDQVLRRQALLESRTTTLNSLHDPAVTGSVRPPGRGEPARTAPRKPQTNGAALTSPTPLREAMHIPSADSTPPTTGVGGLLSRLQASLDTVEARQSASLMSIEQRYDANARLIRDVLVELGVNSAKPETRSTSAIGGPFVAARPNADADTFARHVHRVQFARSQLDRLTRTLEGVPLRRPLIRPLDLVSGFGMRLDPFIRAPAMHTGLDFRGESGDDIRATATGKVTIAGWNGGYGKLVEIDHGNGFASRYGHMSEIGVKVGQSVKAGQIVGKVGSTGRSTGPHLHYETRIAGEAVDPQKFLRAGLKLGGMH
jgi:murein DD-endopeptidase MepM/ murein hydrolase activator NlpD